MHRDRPALQHAGQQRAGVLHAGSSSCLLLHRPAGTALCCQGRRRCRQAWCQTLPRVPVPRVHQQRLTCMVTASSVTCDDGTPPGEWLLRPAPVQFNIFGRTFQAVLENDDSEVQWDTSRRGFDASVVYIHKWVERAHTQTRTQTCTHTHSLTYEHSVVQLCVALVRYGAAVPAVPAAAVHRLTQSRNGRRLPLVAHAEVCLCVSCACLCCPTGTAW